MLLLQCDAFALFLEIVLDLGRQPIFCQLLISFMQLLRTPGETLLHIFLIEFLDGAGYH